MLKFSIPRGVIYHKLSDDFINIFKIFFSNLKTSLDLIKTDYDYIVTFLDTYNSKIRGIDFNKFSNKHVVILDFKTKCKSDFTIDHTFGRNYNYHKNKKITGRI